MTHRIRRRDRPFLCRTCRGPCPRYAGPLGWLCDTCIDQQAETNAHPDITRRPQCDEYGNVLCNICRGPCSRRVKPWLCDYCIVMLIVRDDPEDTPCT